jgi:hypothetical protein
MRTATRIALVLTGSAILIVAMATPGARADRGRIVEEDIIALSALQRAQPQQQPGRIQYVQAEKVLSVATAIAHPSSAPAVANLDRGDRWGESEVALAGDIDGTRNKSVASPTACDGDTFAAQQRNASDGGRSPVTDRSRQAWCLKDEEPKPRTRQAVIGDLDLSQMQSPEAAPVVVKFEAVIKIDLAGLNW